MKAWLKKLVAFFYVYSEIVIKDVLYMRRWRFLPDWLPGFRVHNILQSDDDRALHDHPFSFVTFILKGGYYEYLADGSKTLHRAPAVLYRPATTMHRIELFRQWRVMGPDGLPWIQSPGLVPAWTFVLRTRYFREWGFATKNGWVHNKAFVQKREGHHIDTGNAK